MTRAIIIAIPFSLRVRISGVFWLYY
jgi:hypothetical protein